MNKDLDKWLNWAWQNRQEIMRRAGQDNLGNQLPEGDLRRPANVRGYSNNRGTQMIYSYYTGALGGQVTENLTAQEARDPDLNQFALQMAMTKLELSAFQVDLQRDRTYANLSVSTLEQMHLEYVAGGFFHFIKASIPTNQRVYVNLKPVGRGRSFRRLLSMIKDVPGLDRAKVAAPGLRDADGNVFDRADTVVIYMRDETAQTAVVDALRDFNRANRNLFRAQLPRLVRPVEGLVGVGCASEPPSVQILRVNGNTYFQRSSQSFGAYRSEIIFAALEGALRSNSRMPDFLRLRWFKQRAAKLLRHGGVDPKNPALQGDYKGDLVQIVDRGN